MWRSAILPLLLTFSLASPVFSKDAYLFTSFRSNGETGIFLAASQDGKTWTPLNGDQAWIKPKIPGMLMRDPWLGQGPDGIWHLLWTTGWTSERGRLMIGHASSKDLLTWSTQTEIAVMENEPTARNAWASEAVWDPAAKQWTLFWASTIPDRFPQAPEAGDNGYNHRIYATSTRDWQSFTPSKLWFDPRFNCIDSTVVRDGNRWVMVFKDERKEPLKKQLRIAFADSPAGPWGSVSEPFTPSWVEGPTALKIGEDWWIYFDHYTKPQHYGAMRTNDWKNFVDVTGQVSFPSGQRHGTAVRIPEEMRKILASQQRH